ncbi:hypothetical protein CC85DRAFT_329230 [Cutaneotrichosporon oleaginosum]|uniref:Uncharacterized protein n=1 Tax=Cutaneotrichosporon oleaginosum TaxID=879819 RepID=A0A0J0XJG0_9TREE|nr:uncharacterized protein CC85DRAFT_329230 [Cutaneotrichosporon oleaginosum]KLT41240.1 hypothetical protein CC85DRAFT_329230 [Cutaneotrichosporon oleaginosum]TXT05503.1 hypothetical protein COLE_06823 [Cutaneotrichosporon oleaginosum]
MSTHLLPHSPEPSPSKKLRSCLSPHRRSEDPIGFRPSSAMSSSSGYTEDSNGEWVERRSKTVHWIDSEDGSFVTSYFDTYAVDEYDRTPLAPPSEQERACVLPARGSRCLSFSDLAHEEVDDEDDSTDEEEVLRRLPPSPFATPEDSDSEREDDDEWDECFERRRMMFARMCPLDSDAHPQFEGYRSLSATLVSLLQSVQAESDDEDASATPRASFHEGEDDDTASEGDDERDDFVSRDLPFPLFSRLRESSTDSDEVGTPSLISSADSDTECSGLMSPRGSAVEFLPSTRLLSSSNEQVPSTWKGVSPVRYNVAPNEQALSIEL